MESREKTVKLLESFLSDKQVDGVCGYMVDPDGEGPIQVIVVLDIDYIQEANTKPGFIAKMIREGVKQEIKKWIGLDVYVGSTSKKCDEIESLSESMASHVKRRLSNVKILDELTTILEYEINIENFDNASDAVEELCNTLNERILDEIWETTHRKVSLAEKDELYWHIYNRFNKFITHRYNETQEMNESVVYNYKKGRNTIPERLPFDVNKLIDAAAIFITPSIDGKPTSKNYKKFLKAKHTHLITLYNLKHSSPDSWVHTAVTRFAPPTHWDDENFSNNLYDGKYNQILWSLDELGIPYESMLIDEVDESKKKYIVTESQYNIILESQKHIQIFQELIDNEMAYIRRVCEKGADDYEGDVGDESCNQIESVEKVTVTDADWVTVMHSNQPLEQKYMSIKLMVYFSSIRRGDFDADDLSYDLEKIIRKKTSMPVIINYESTNTNTSFEW
jgi:hypothetical protein